MQVSGKGKSTNFRENLKVACQGFVGMNLCLLLAGYLAARGSVLSAVFVAVLFLVILVGAGFRSQKIKLMFWTTMVTLASSLVIIYSAAADEAFSPANLQVTAMITSLVWLVGLGVSWYRSRTDTAAKGQ